MMPLVHIYFFENFGPKFGQEGLQLKIVSKCI